MAPTDVAVWAPAFSPYLSRVTVENSQAMFADGAWCRLCETRIGVGRTAHAREHDRELKQWRADQAKLRRRQQREQLALLNRERRLTRRVLGRAA
jgi:hypothetical protein